MAHETRATGIGTGAGTVNMNMSGNSSLTVTAASQGNPGTSRDEKTGGQYTPTTGYKKLPNTENIYICTGKPFREGATVYPGYKILGTGDELPVAIKIIRDCTDENLKEVEHLKNLAGHSNVVQIIDVAIKENDDDIDKTMYIVMERCSESLQSFLDDKLSKEDPLNLKQTMSFAWELVKGIKHIHSEGIIHGDIKPENILISMHGRCIKVSDFGISKRLRLGRSSTKPNGGIGTNGYRAPEIHKRQTISKGSDMYSLGLTLASIFSRGKHLHGDDLDKANVRIKENEDPDYSILMVEGKKGEQLKSLLSRMLQFERSKRITIEDVERDPFWIENSPSLDQATSDDTKPQTAYDTEETLLAEQPSVSEEILDFPSGPVHPASETNPPEQQKTTEESTSEEPSRIPYILSATSDVTDTVCGDPSTNNDAEIRVNAFKQRTVAEKKAVENPSRMLGDPQAGSRATNPILTDHPNNFATMESSNPPDQPKLTKELASLDVSQVPSIPVHPASETNPPGQQKTIEESTSEEPSRTPGILLVPSIPVHPASEMNPPEQQKTIEESTSEEPSRTPNILSATSGATNTVCGDPPTNNDSEIRVNAFKQRTVAEKKAIKNPSRMLGDPQAGSRATNPILTDHPNNFATMESSNPPDQLKLTKELASLDVSRDASGAISQDFSAPLLPTATEGRQISSREGMVTTLSSQILNALSPVFQPCFKGPISPVEGGSPSFNSIRHPGFEETEFLVKPSLFISTEGNLCLILRTGNAPQNEQHCRFIPASIMLSDFHVKAMERVPICISCEDPKGYTVEPRIDSFVADKKFARVGEQRLSFAITPQPLPAKINLRCRIGVYQRNFWQNIPEEMPQTFLHQSRNPKLEDSSAGYVPTNVYHIENVQNLSADNSGI